MEQEPTSEARKTTELFRPREIVSDPSNLLPEVGLFGTCGTPASTWRHDIFIPRLEAKGLSYFNPQVGPGEWTPEMAEREAESMANDEVIVVPISNETHGYGSLGEAGWAILSALLRGQKLGIFVEEDETMPEEAIRARNLFKILAKQLQLDYPVFQFKDNMIDLADWAATTMKECVAMGSSKIKDVRTINLPTDVETLNCVGIFGTQSPTPEWKRKLIENFEKGNVSYFDPYKEGWDDVDAAAEIEHKTKDKVLLQIITGETESYGSLAESGLMALSAFVRGQAYGLYIEDHPSNPKSDTNRARTLVKAHAKKLNEQFPGIVFLADSIEELQEWAIKTINKEPSSPSMRSSIDEVRGKIGSI